jgi:iron(III) transport system permease protein
MQISPVRPWRITGLYQFALVILVLFIAFFVVAPLIAILYRAVIDVDGGNFVLTGRHLSTVLSDSIYWTALLNTVVISLGASCVATAIGTVFAWIFVRTDTIGRGFFEAVSQLPIFIPPFVGAVAWMLLAAPRSGIINRLFAPPGSPGALDV